MAMAVAMGGRGGGSVPRRRGPAGGAARQPDGQGGRPAPGLAAAAHGLAQSSPAAGERWQQDGAQRRHAFPATIVHKLKGKPVGEME